MLEIMSCILLECYCVVYVLLTKGAGLDALLMYCLVVSVFCFAICVVVSFVFWLL